MDTTEQQFSLTLSSEPFCTFCLRASPPKVQLYKYVTGGFVELRLSFESILGYEFQLDSFAICKPCWSLVQLFQDFRTQCQRANGLVERIGHGLKGEGDNGWFGEENLATIEGIQKVVQDQLAQIERVDAKAEDVRKIKTESVEVEVEQCTGVTREEPKAAESSQQLGQNKDVPAPAFHMVEIKVEHHDEVDSEECDEASKSAAEPKDEGPEKLEQTTQPSPHLPVESAKEDKEMEVEPSDEGNPECNEPSVLVECVKCSRKFDKSKSMKLHSMSCDGTLPSRLLTCELCKASFLDRRLLSTHMNKHEGKTPFPCRKLCKASFISAQIRNRHELTCCNDRRKCTLCEEVLPDQMRLFAHYRLAHPGELRYPCPTCHKRFKRRDALASHERRLHSESRPKTEACQICGKMFAELNDLKGHVKLMHENPGGARAKPAQCEVCGKRCSKQNSLNIHMAAAHPELTTEANLDAYRRRCVQNMERKRRKKMVEQG
uniref:Zinc finger and BTB domain-containing protein 48 n=1 Tax=Culex pipiens TaxID=7175 RepID=A0A8D8CM20_CULPI